MSAVLGVIPARLGSERLPRKPLHVIAGRPLIEWVWRRATGLPSLDAVVVATDSPEVGEACDGFGARWVSTSATHASGTDRVAEVADMAPFRSFEIIVNVQGDEPFVTEEQVRGAVDEVRAGWDVGTVAAPVGTLEAWRDPTVVKVARNDQGAALYFSRAPIPYRRAGAPDPSALASDPYLRHIGVYAYSRRALREWVRLPVGELEAIERLEQLRPLAAGLSFGVAVVAAAEGGIDTEEDARRAAERLGGQRDGGMNRDEVE